MPDLERGREFPKVQRETLETAARRGLVVKFILSPSFRAWSHCVLLRGFNE